MLFATDKFTLSFGDTAKLTIQYENTTLTNTGKKQAIVEASKDGYTWAQVASIAPDSSLPLKIEALYVRLTTDTTISVVNTNPIPRDTKKTDIAVNINTEALVIKDDLQAYVSKNELNDLVHHPDLSGFVTKSQVQQMIPEIPTPPDITGLASKESVELKADQTAVDDLKLTIATKADTTTMAALETTVTESVIPAITHLNTIKADKTELNTLAEQVAQSKATVGTLATQVTGFQSALDDRVTKEQAENANRVLLNAIAARASQEELDALHDVVEQKANQEQVSELNNKTFHLEQDKANKVDVIELTKAVNLIQNIISGEVDLALLKEIKSDVLAMINPELPVLIDEALSTHDTMLYMRNSIMELFRTVATQDQVSDLFTQLQTKADTEHSHAMSDVTGLAEALADKSDAAHTHAWTSIIGKPSSFIPSDHTHPTSEITGLDAALSSKADTEHDHTVDDVTGLQEALNSKSPTNHTHTWGSITGKPSTFSPSSHTHAIADVSGLQAALDGKAPTSHSHSWSSITGKPTTFTPSTHTHGITDVSGLQDALDAKAPATHSHTVNWADISGKPTTFNPSTHTHSIANVTGLQAALDNKASNDHTHTISWNALTDKPASYPPAAHSHDWNSITGKPTTFAPSSHTHNIADVSGLQDALAGKSPSNHTHSWEQITGVPNASTGMKGIVQLNDTLTSTAINQALTANQGKVLNDKLDSLAVGGRNLVRQGESVMEYSNDFILLDDIKVGEAVVVTLWGELGADRTAFAVHNTQGYNELARLAKIKDGVYQARFLWGANAAPNGQQNQSLKLYAYPSNAKSTSRIDKIKLERGNIATDWTPAPEDIDAQFVQTNANSEYISQQFTYRAYASHLLGAKVMRNLYSKLTVMTIRADCTTNKVINLPEAFSDTTYFWIARGESTKGWIKGTTTSTSRITLDSTDNPDATGIINILAIGYKA